MTDETDWVQVADLTPLELAYLRDGELKAGRIPRDVLRARMDAAAGTELARIRERGETVSIRTVGTDRGRRIITTSVASHEEARIRS